MNGHERILLLRRLERLNKQLVKNGLTPSYDLEAAEALTDDDLTEAVDQTSHILVEDTRRLRG